ncbi:hypothetical protein [Hoylesella saccharolytica]|uniref:hypothetical protein n=1 Tax=Hoylesella saccharolytica TaxID=633701 RepID=UPI001F3CDC36|nr:hypothetical protein [Hoylesella saccharolytica]
MGADRHLQSYQPAYNGSKGDKREIYPAFYWADAYREEMKTKCTNEGKAFDSNLLTQKGRWFLPSVNEWMQLLKNVGFSNPNSLFAPGGVATGAPISVWYNVLIVRQAFIVAGGAPLWMIPIRRDDTTGQVPKARPPTKLYHHYASRLELLPLRPKEESHRIPDYLHKSLQSACIRYIL